MKKRTTSGPLVAVRHSKECFAVEAVKRGDWDTAWGPPAFGDYGKPLIRTERRYGKIGRRSYHWLVYVCNDPGCPGRLHVETEWILKAAEKALPAPSPQRGMR